MSNFSDRLRYTFCRKASTSVMEVKRVPVSNCATITWNVNNFRYCWQKNDEAIASPVFCVNMPKETKWKILLFPRGVAFQDTCISLFLHREMDRSAPEEIEVEYTLDIIDSDGFGVVDLPDVVQFRKDMQSGSPRYIHRSVITAKPMRYLPNGCLIIRCKMFQCDGVKVQKQQIFARTVIGFEKRFLRWIIEDFGKALTEEPRTFFIKSETEDGRMQVDISVATETKENIFFDMELLDSEVKVCVVHAFVMNIQNQEVDSGEFEYWFVPETDTVFPLKHTKGRLLNNRALYLPNNTLTMTFDLTFSSGFAFVGLEKAACECNPISNDAIDIRNCISHKGITDCPCELITDLASLHKDQSTCDMKLQTKSKVFPVHTLILSARSPVFKALFSSEMTTETNGCVVVSDLHDSTVWRFLIYLYSDQLENLKWDDAVELYKVANKYVVNSLKEKCCIYLKNNLNLENACKALIFSDLHQEQELKELVQSFMLINAKVIFKSEEWMILVENNTRLALETTLRNWDDE